MPGNKLSLCHDNKVNFLHPFASESHSPMQDTVTCPRTAWTFIGKPPLCGCGTATQWGINEYAEQNLFDSPTRFHFFSWRGDDVSGTAK